MQTTFTWIDYGIFVFMLVLSSIIGVYYGFFKKQKTAADFLLGGRQMKILPMAISIVSSQLSGLAVIALPADIFKYGINYWLTVPLMILVSMGSYYIYLAVFYKLEVTSIYEYLSLRFDNKVRIFASVLFTLNLLLFLPIIIYVPALALSQVTNLSIHYITPVVCSVCIFYTTIGGMKAMVKTDAIQFAILMSTMVFVLIVGTWTGGGFGTIFRKAYEGGRLSISFDLSPTTRDTFWGGTIGAFFMLSHYFSCNQSYVQKFSSLPTFKSVKRALILSTLGVMAVKTLCMYGGLLIYSKYGDCDPMKVNIVKKHDQLFPMYIMEETSFLPGLPGLFLSGIFSAALSTLSASLNCLSATIYEDFISPFMPKDISQTRISFYLKFIVVFIGIFSTVAVFIVEKLGALLQLAISLSAITGGPILGLFTVGMLIPKVNAKGAFFGGVTSLVIMSWIIMSGLWYQMQQIITYSTLPTSTAGCNETVVGFINTTISLVASNATTINPMDEGSFLFSLYKLTFYWYVLIGGLIFLLSSVAVSYLTKADKFVDKNCFSPLVHFLFKEDDKPPQYDTIENALQMVNKS